MKSKERRQLVSVVYQTGSWNSKVGGQRVKEVCSTGSDGSSSLGTTEPALSVLILRLHFPILCPVASLQPNTHPVTAWGKWGQLPTSCFPE